MTVFVGILEFIFGCHHRQLSRVFTIEGRTYRVCCSCGAEFEYSLASMTTKRSRRRAQQAGRVSSPLPVYNNTTESTAEAAV